MGQAQTLVIEGTSEEIATRLVKSYPEQNLRVTVEPQEEDLLEGMPPPPNSIRSKEHLIELLKQGLSGSRHEVTEETWEQRRVEVDRHAAHRTFSCCVL